jgi:hypothetical protein
MQYAPTDYGFSLNRLMNQPNLRYLILAKIQQIQAIDLVRAYCIRPQ